MMDSARIKKCITPSYVHYFNQMDKISKENKGI